MPHLTNGCTWSRGGESPPSTGRWVALDPGALLLIEAGETHEIATDGAGAPVTVNVYAPAAY